MIGVLMDVKLPCGLMQVPWPLASLWKAANPWLRSEREDKHINLAEIDAILRGINMALQWRATVGHLKSDSTCVHQWVSDTLSGMSRVYTKAATEMLIRRQLSTIKELVEEYKLTVDIELVRSHAN